MKKVLKQTKNIAYLELAWHMQKKTKTKKFKIATSAKAPYMGKIWFLRHQIFFCKYFWDNSYLGHTSESIPHPCFNCGWLAEYKRKQKTYTWSKLSCPILSMILNQLVLNCLTICLTTTRFFWGLFPLVSWEVPPNFEFIFECNGGYLEQKEICKI